MIIVRGFPPIYEEAAKRFNIRGRKVVFAWGDKIYDPFDANIGPDLEVHEAVHGEQQKAIGGPEIWWHKYFIDANFRLEQEIQAYRAQYKFFCKQYRDRNQQTQFLSRIAGDLSTMYDLPITRAEAMHRIKL